jgi:DNA-binding HxlR family transcriptional regulator
MTRIKPDVFNANCDSRQVLELIADRWSMLVIYALSNQVRRHSELKRRIGGISQKMLTQTLRSLERDGLVSRSVYDVVPPRVEYALTPLGQTLLEPLRAICRWAEKYLPQVKSARTGARDDGSVSSGRQSVVRIAAPTLRRSGAKS